MSSPSSSTSLSWTCSQCTFTNPNSHQPTCQICLTPQAQTQISLSPSSSSKPTWSCKSCTFHNSYKNNNCQICGTRASASLLTALETGYDDDIDPSVGSVFLPLQRCKRKIREVKDMGFGGSKGSGLFASSVSVKSAKNEVAVLDKTCTIEAPKTLKILSYNVWFREDLEMRQRMNALGNLIEMLSPDIICLQEVTPNIYDIFQQSSWWKLYKCSVSSDIAFTRAYFCMQLSKMPGNLFSCKPFRNSIMGRELCVAEVVSREDKSLVIATSHLESPCPGPPKWDQMYSKERVDQAKEAINFLKQHKNVIFCGDMNWDDKLDGPVPTPDGWVDAWTELRPGELGCTYDTKTNKMLSGNRTLQKRLDRFLCCFQDFNLDRIEMIGMEAIPGLSYCKEKKVKNEVKKMMLPVLPSDHFGLLLTISPS
ncbi:Tyrosyl-DNA phosphodiesterase 2 [Heracleum sosnowskyi]|uniref:Tyrosyl-DNA phosphodiesterase 2 n=1 Tax=Heracleum sosnowskyi TaxID=360622 RepID=A0AAD8MA98_9APIA|nr:Tyrosyl-DNA phosphodiesterase 2 [Heracleum sosnowskyi]